MRGVLFLTRWCRYDLLRTVVLHGQGHAKAAWQEAGLAEKMMPRSTKSIVKLPISRRQILQCVALSPVLASALTWGIVMLGLGVHDGNDVPVPDAPDWWFNGAAPASWPYQSFAPDGVYELQGWHSGTDFAVDSATQSDEWPFGTVTVLRRSAGWPFRSFYGLQAADRPLGLYHMAYLIPTRTIQGDAILVPYRPILVGLAANSLVVATLSVAGCALVGHLRSLRRRRVESVRCPNCGYPRFGRSAICPECGS